MANLRTAEMRSDGNEIVIEIAVDNTEALEGPLQVELAEHDDVTVYWSASFSCERSGDGWTGRLGLEQSTHRHLFQLTSLRDVSGAEIVLGEMRLFLEPIESGLWISGSTADEERLRLERVRTERFDAPLVNPESGADDPSFSIVMLVDNLYLTTAQRVPGIRVLPMEETTLGSDVVEVINSVLQQLGFADGVPPPSWAHEMKKRRPAAVIQIRQVQALNGEAAHSYSRKIVQQLLDLLALRRGAAPRLLGGVVGLNGNHDGPRYSGFWVEGADYAGNMLGGFLSGEGLHGLLDQWDGLTKDPRVRLWLSLYADAIADERWDYRLFRCFNLLEGIGSEIVPRGMPIVDASGVPRLQTNGKPYTTKHTRGKIYELLKMVCIRSQTAEISFVSRRLDGVVVELWDEIPIWSEIRDAVAHRGGWQLVEGATPSAKHTAIEGEIAARGFDGTFERGAISMIRTIRSATEAVLRSALRGLL